MVVNKHARVGIVKLIDLQLVIKMFVFFEKNHFHKKEKKRDY